MKISQNKFHTIREQSKFFSVYFNAKEFAERLQYGLYMLVNYRIEYLNTQHNELVLLSSTVKIFMLQIFVVVLDNNKEIDKRIIICIILYIEKKEIIIQIIGITALKYKEIWKYY